MKNNLHCEKELIYHLVFPLIRSPIIISFIISRRNLKEFFTRTQVQNVINNIISVYQVNRELFVKQKNIIIVIIRSEQIDRKENQILPEPNRSSGSQARGGQLKNFPTSSGRLRATPRRFIALNPSGTSTEFYGIYAEPIGAAFYRAPIETLEARSIRRRRESELLGRAYKL